MASDHEDLIVSNNEMEIVFIDFSERACYFIKAIGDGIRGLMIECEGDSAGDGQAGDNKVCDLHGYFDLKIK